MVDDTALTPLLGQCACLAVLLVTMASRGHRWVRLMIIEVISILPQYGGLQSPNASIFGTPKASTE